MSECDDSIVCLDIVKGAPQNWVPFHDLKTLQIAVVRDLCISDDFKYIVLCGESKLMQERVFSVLKTTAPLPSYYGSVELSPPWGSRAHATFEFHRATWEVAFLSCKFVAQSQTVVVVGNKESGLGKLLPKKASQKPLLPLNSIVYPAVFIIFDCGSSTFVRKAFFTWPEVQIPADVPNSFRLVSSPNSRFTALSFSYKKAREEGSVDVQNCSPVIILDQSFNPLFHESTRNKHNTRDHSTPSCSSVVAFSPTCSNYACSNLNIVTVRYLLVVLSSSSSSFTSATSTNKNNNNSSNNSAVAFRFEKHSSIVVALRFSQRTGRILASLDEKGEIFVLDTTNRSGAALHKMHESFMRTTQSSTVLHRDFSADPDWWRARRFLFLIFEKGKYFKKSGVLAGAVFLISRFLKKRALA